MYACRKDLKIESNNETGDRNEEKIDGKCRNSKYLKIRWKMGMKINLKRY